MRESRPGANGGFKLVAGRAELADQGMADWSVLKEDGKRVQECHPVDRKPHPL